MNDRRPFSARVAARALRWAPAPLGELESGLAKRAFLDTVGVAAAAWRLRSAHVAAEALEIGNAGGDGRIIASSLRASPADAALMNGLLAHAQLFDDNSDPMIAHPSGPLVAVAIAIGPRMHAGGGALLDAYAAGFDTSVVLGRMLNPQHYERGWHATSTIGIFGATVVAAKLLGCTESELVNALAIAASGSAGIRQNFGSMTMGLHAGNAARAATVAALLAQRGFTASPYAFEGRSGYFETFGPPSAPYETLERGEHELRRSGIQFKLYPSGAPTLCAVEAALEVFPHITGPIEAVTCEVDPWYEKTLKEDEPSDGFEAKVNLRYCLARVLLDGRLELDDFEPDSVNDPTVHALMKRISVRVDPSLAGAGTFPARVRVLSNGVERQAERRHPRGTPQVPARDTDLIAKFTACVRDVADAPEASAIAERILNLERERAESVYELLALSASSGSERRDGIRS